MRSREHISREEALMMLMAHFSPMGVKKVPTRSSVGLILGENVFARLNIPNSVVSAVDGYAVLSESTANASPQRPVVLEKQGYVWVNTGSMVPPPFDSVVMVEDVSRWDDGTVVVYRASPKGQNLRYLGEDVMSNQLLAFEGDQITPQLASLLISAGVLELKAIPKPRILFIPTGEEIVGDDALINGIMKPGDVLESNSILVTGYLERCGYRVDVHSSILSDNVDELRGVLKRAVMDDYHVILISGGSAKGLRDVSAEALKDGLLFRWLLMKPGRPAIGASFDGCPVIVLPGFPSSSLVVLLTVVVPFLNHLSGKPPMTYFESLDIEPWETQLLHRMSSSPGMEEWVKAKVVKMGDQALLWPLGGGSSSLFSLGEADGLACIPSSSVELDKGDKVRFYPLVHLDLARRCLLQGSDDPALQMLAAIAKGKGGEVVVKRTGSMGGVLALARGEAHAATCHILDPDTGIYNDPLIKRLDPHGLWCRTILFYREQGFILARGNPRGVKGIRDLVRDDIRIVNRQPGAGTRILLDHLLEKDGISRDGVKGYNDLCVSHLDAAARVLAGAADVALGVKSAADALGLDFIPIAEEPYELVYHSAYLDHPGIMALMEAALDPKWRSIVDRMGGYRWP
ncbi:substrate-binding domain-containing protein [Thermanaerovibrio velox]|nr:substrate-binding domain-containing protein [Thermanaerovibrio velox]